MKVRVDELKALGYVVTNQYSDGVVRLAKLVEVSKTEPTHAEVFLFVSSDGTVGPPQSVATAFARIELHENKIPHRFYSKEQKERDEKVAERVAWLRETLIPDLYESGGGESATAEDFEMCCDFLDSYLAERTI